jgi:dephospho-CoA kinase
MLLIGLTGGIATGKSLAAQYFLAKTIPVIDADDIAKNVMEAGQPAYKVVVKTFKQHGYSNVILSNGQIDRNLLASLVFDHSSASTSTVSGSTPSNAVSYRKLLNACTHPYILREIIRQLCYYYLCFTSMVVLEIPLLIETGLYKYIHDVLVIYISDVEIQLQRLISRNPTLSRDQAMARIQAQLPLSTKVRLATHIIDNGLSKENTYDQLHRLVCQWKEAQNAWPRYIFRILVYIILCMPISLIYISLTVLESLHL